jgi:hypothetical protein
MMIAHKRGSVAVAAQLQINRRYLKLQKVNRIFVIVATPPIFFLASCGMFGSSAEEMNQQPHKTTFRSADHDNIDNPPSTPTPRKIPGE